MPGAGPWGMHDGWFGWWPMGGLLWLVVVALLIVGLFAVVRRAPGQRNGSSDNSGALKVLDERYARGEIDRDEYLQRRKEISGD